MSGILFTDERDYLLKREPKMKNLENKIAALLKENTGVHMLDSGGDNGRMWQRNQDKDFEKEPEVVLENGYFTVSLYHYLLKTLSTNSMCDIVNAYINENDIHWGGEVDLDSVSNGAFEGLFENISEQFNTYNWSAPFSQDFTGITFEYEGEKYVLLQIHNGADIRGGYTGVQCFKCNYYFGYVDVIGRVNDVDVDTNDGTHLTTENGENIEYDENSKHDLSIYITEY